MTAEPILIVDDDVEFLAYLRSTLERAGHAVESAKDGATACRRVQAGRFALVLADLKLPEMSGLDVLKAARQAAPLTVGVVFTAHSSVETALEALREGAYDYLLKPCEPEVILAAVRRALEHHALNQTVIQKTAQLERLQTELLDKTQLIQNASHEFRNPLTVVAGYTSFILRQGFENADPEELKRNLAAVHRNAERLSVLLEELMEATRLSQHKIRLERRPADAGELAREALDNLRLEAVRLDIGLEIEVPVRRLLVDADSHRVHQILSNLLGNALKFTPRGGAVRLSLRTGDGEAVFEVRDSGVGIAGEDLPRLFERFYQAEASRRNNKGLGLGLHLCKGLVELHGGRIWAESAPGSGSSFFFSLPLAGSPARPERHADELKSTARA